MRFLHGSNFKVKFSFDIEFEVDCTFLLSKDRVISKGIANLVPCSKIIKWQFLNFLLYIENMRDSDLVHYFEDGNKLKVPTEIKASWKMMIFCIWISHLNFALSSGHNSGDQLREEEKYSKLSQEASISRNLSWEDDDDVITPISNRKKLSWVSECAEVQYIIWPTKVILCKSCGEVFSWNWSEIRAGLGWFGRVRVYEFLVLFKTILSSNT